MYKSISFKTLSTSSWHFSGSLSSWEWAKKREQGRTKVSKVLPHCLSPSLSFFLLSPTTQNLEHAKILLTNTSKGKEVVISSNDLSRMKIINYMYQMPVLIFLPKHAKFNNETKFPDFGKKLRISVTRYKIWPTLNKILVDLRKVFVVSHPPSLTLPSYWSPLHQTSGFGFTSPPQNFQWLLFPTI